MRNLLLEKTKQHLILLESANNMTRAILVRIEKDELEAVVMAIDNRERLFNIIDLSQQTIENTINSLPQEMISSDLVEELKSWQQEVDRHVASIQSIDQELLEILEQEKTATTAEIAKMFTMKQTFKGYNLNKVND